MKGVGSVLYWFSAILVQCYIGSVLYWFSAILVQCYMLPGGNST